MRSLSVEDIVNDDIKELYKLQINDDLCFYFPTNLKSSYEIPIFYMLFNKEYRNEQILISHISSFVKINDYRRIKHGMKGKVKIEEGPRENTFFLLPKNRSINEENAEKYFRMLERHL